MSQARSGSALTRRALQIASTALDQPESQRLEWAKAQCANDQALQSLVLKLLAADQTDEPRIDSPEDVGSTDDQRLGTCIDRYRISAKIGSGGMGVVYRAEPEQGVARLPVALKLIKRGMDSDEIVRRFMRERAILARLEHPNITRLLDGGMTDDGRPWFALELVNGEPLLCYCDRLQLGIEARIDLFLQVCDAVEYAHRNLVIHRDLKPGNVLVTRDGLVKLLDFGIAKLIEADDARTTQTRALLMTPEYAAPEQTAGGPITTQTDVYQLGLMLAELLSGHRTPARQTDSPGAVPSRLNAAFSGRSAAGDPHVLAVAANRGSSVRGLARTLRGDLDRIVRRATSLEPQRRYLSASAIGEDLKRYRQGRPVLASGDSLGYLARMFLRRHRVAVAAGLAVVLALAIGVASTLRETERLRIALGQSALMQGLLTEVFLGADPYAAKAGDTRASDLLSAAEHKLRSDAGLPPALTAALWYKLGQAYVSLDDSDRAIAAMRQAAAASDSALVCSGLACVGADPVQLRIMGAGARARLAHYALRPDPARSDAASDLTGAVSELRALGEPAFAELSKVLQLVGDQDFNRGDYARLDALSAEIVDLARRSSGVTSSDLLMALVYRSSTLRAIGEHRLALQAAESANALMELLGTEVTDYMRLLAEQKYGAALSANAQAVKAEPLLRSALQRAIALRGERSTVASGLMWDLALTQSELGHHAQASELIRSLLAHAEDNKTANLFALHNALGRALRGLGDASGASRELRLAESIACASTPMIVPCAVIKLNLADAEQAQQHFGVSGSLLSQTESLAKQAGGRTAMRWQLLAARQAIAEKDPVRAGAALDQSREALADASLITPLDRVAWLQVESDVLGLQGKNGSALARLSEAEQLILQHRPEDAVLIEQIQAAMSRIQRP
jgi:tetratricopeptide (TPR) repeat protein